MTDTEAPQPTGKNWVNRTVVAIIFATFFSDVSHEMCTAVLPLYLATVGLGPAALGLIEGVADFLVSLSKLAGGYVGHHVERNPPWASLGYLVTTLGTWGIAFVGSPAAVLSLRSVGILQQEPGVARCCHRLVRLLHCCRGDAGKGGRCGIAAQRAK